MEGYIITGGPGSGKSTLLDALCRAGYRCYGEVSRELIREQSQLPDGVLPWKNMPAFARLAFHAMASQHEHALRSGGICFFDRGLPDIFGYLEAGGYPVPQEYLDVHAACRYQRRVFVLPPWQEIFVNDSERPQSYPESVELYRSICRAYERLGYELCDVPKSTVSQRVALLRSVTG
ncbi:MAG: AAA family ATPase [Chlorobiaceae bacterium]|jgi:predicted ATPase|nr:AAA family ATPase [Chlorobiaceae bacterium]